MMPNEGPDQAIMMSRTVSLLSFLEGIRTTAYCISESKNREREEGLAVLAVSK